MRGIFLAAGRGKRMGNLTDNHPKALLKLHNKPLIEWQMEAVRQCSIEKIAIVNGYQSGVFTYPVSYFNNPRWDHTNMLSTLLCASEWLKEDTCLVSYTDIVYTSEAIDKLIHSPGDIAITYDPKWLDLWQKRFDNPLSDAEIFKYRDNLLIDIGGKTNNLADIQGQYMGLLRITPAGWSNIKTILHTLDKTAVDKMDMTSLLKLMLINNYKIFVTAINSSWCEIDEINDYELCHEIFKKDIPATAGMQYLLK